MIPKSPEALHELAVRVLKAAGAAGENADAVAAALVQAEQDGLPEYGLARLPTLAERLRGGEVAGWARPEVSLPMPAVVRVDAKGGFAAPALGYAIAAAQEAAEQHGIAAAGIVDGRHVGFLGYYAEKLGERGFVALMAAESAFAFACPRRNDRPLVVESAAAPAELAAMVAVMAGALAAGGVAFVAIDRIAYGVGDIFGGLDDVMERLADDVAVAAADRRYATRARNAGAIAVEKALYDKLLLLGRGGD